MYIEYDLRLIVNITKLSTSSRISLKPICTFKYLNHKYLLNSLLLLYILMRLKMRAIKILRNEYRVIMLFLILSL